MRAGSGLPRRRRAIAAALLLLIAAAVPSGCRRSEEPRAEPAPPPAAPAAAAPERIVLVTIDTLRADHVGCYGYARTATPTLDRLAADGVRFRQAVVQAPLTLPSHCSILTGAYPAVTGVRDQAGFVLGPEQVTLAEALKQAGYATGAFVGSAVLSARTGLAQGFDHYSEVPEPRGGPVDPAMLERRAEEVVAAALAWMEAPGRGRFFAWIHVFDPHTPYAAPEPFRSRFRSAPYDGEIAYVDSVLGGLVARFRERGWYDPSLLVVTADHGESLGEHGEATHGFFLYDAVLVVPLIVKAPGAAWKGRVVAEAVRAVDVAPTVLTLAGLPKGSRMQGESLVRRMSGPAAPALSAYSETYFPYYHFEWSPLRALRTGREKYVEAPRPELYDLERDPGERSNRAAEDAALAAALAGRLRAEFGDGGTAAAPAPAPVDPAMAERLRSLGYIGSSAPHRAPAGARLPDPKDRIDVYVLLQEALHDGEAGRTDAANAKLRKVLARDDRIVDAHLNLGVNLAQAGHPAEAAAHFKRVLALDERNLLATLDLALCDAQLGRLDEAIAGFRRTLELDPKELGALVGLGRALAVQGQTPEAIDVLRRAVDREPRLAEARLYLAEAYAAAGRTAEAARERAEARRLGAR